MAKKEKQAASDGGQDDKIKSLEEQISRLSLQLEEASKKKQADPALVESLTSRISSLEEKLEEAEKISKIELPDGADDDVDPAAKKTGTKKKTEISGSGVGMF